MNVRELVARIGLDIDFQKLDKLDKGLNNTKAILNEVDTGFSQLQSKIKAFTIGSLVSATGIFALTNSVAKSVKANSDLAEQIGVSAQSLQRLELLAQSAGLKVGTLSSSMISFNKQLGAAKISVSGISRDFEVLGLSIRNSDGTMKSSTQIYTDVISKIASIGDVSKKTALAQKLLGSSGLEIVSALGKNRQELEKQISLISKLAYIVDDKGIKASKELTRSWSLLGIAASSLKTQFGVKLAPAINDTINKVINLYIENRKIIDSGIDAFVSNVTFAFKGLYNILQILFLPIKELSTALGGFNNLISIVATTMLTMLIPAIFRTGQSIYALGVAILGNPLFTMGVAISLLLNDLYHFAEGNDSVIGKVLKSWFGFEGTIIDLVRSITNTLKELAINTVSFFTMIFDSLITPFKRAKDFILGESKNILDESKNISNKISSSVKSIDNDYPKEIEVVRKDASGNIVKERINSVTFEPVKEDKVSTAPNITNNINNNTTNPIQNDNSNLRSLSIRTIRSPIGATDKINAATINDNSIVAANRNMVTDRNVKKIDQSIFAPKLVLQPDDLIKRANLPYNETVKNKPNFNKELNLSQNISQNITINVPTGTTQEQMSSINTQVAEEVSRQFEYQILRAFDSIAAR